MRYREWAAESGVIPAFIAGPVGRAWSAAWGVMQDAIAEGARQAARVRWLSTCPEDALAYHGEALGWPQAPGETADEYRTRLLKSWHLAEWRGTEKGLLDAYSLIGLTNVEVFEAFTPGWGRHVGHDERARWINIVIRAPHPFGSDFDARYGDGSLYGDGTLYGVDGDPRLIELVRRIARDMSPAHAHVEWVAIVLSGDVKHTGAATDGDPDGASARVAYLVP